MRRWSWRYRRDSVCGIIFRAAGCVWVQNDRGTDKAKSKTIKNVCKHITEFGEYIHGDEILGIFCKTCWKEWLLPIYVSDYHDSIRKHNGIIYKAPLRQRPTALQLLQVTSSREEINPNFVAESVKPADHVMWHRPYVIWHHAIVKDVSGYFVTLIHFSKDENGNCAILRSTVDARNERGTMYLVEYSENIRRYNPPELVIARAEALIGTTDYQLLKRNCENFATFSKTGLNIAHQKGWFENKVNELAKGIGRIAGKEIILPTLLKVSCSSAYYSLNRITCMEYSVRILAKSRNIHIKPY